MEEIKIEWSNYLLYKMTLRGFNQTTVEHLLRHFAERYSDSITGRRVVVGRHHGQLVVIPYEQH